MTATTKKMFAMLGFVVVVVVLLLVSSAGTSMAAAAIERSVTSSYVRKIEASGDMPFTSDVFRSPPGYNAPQQVHITQGDHEGKAVIVSWVTPSEPGSNLVRFGTDEKRLDQTAQGNQYDIYLYEIGDGKSSKRFHFTAPPRVGPDIPYTVIGDLG